jgi:hypothetical protein
MTIPIAPIVGIAQTVLNFTQPGYSVVGALAQGNFSDALKHLGFNVLGLDNDGVFHAADFVQNWTPAMVGIGVHITASKLGVNRMLAKANVPYIRI